MESSYGSSAYLKYSNFKIKRIREIKSTGLGGGRSAGAEVSMRMLCTSLGAVSSREEKSLVHKKRMKPQPRLRKWGAWVESVGGFCLQRGKALGMVRSPWKGTWSDKRGAQDQRPISTNLWEEEEELLQLILG